MKIGKRVNNLVVMLVIVICLFSGCSRYALESEKTEQTSDVVDMDLYEVDICIEDVHSFLYFDGKSIWYQIVKNESATYFRYDIAAKKNIKIGEISNPILISKDRALSYNGLYLYAAREKNQSLSKHLFFLSFEDDSIMEIDVSHISESLIPVEWYGNKLYSLKVDVDNKTGEGVSYIEAFNPTDKKKSILLREEANYKEKVGTALVNFCISDGVIYAYFQNADEQEELVSFIRTYNLNGDMIEDVHLSKLPSVSLRETCADIKVVGELIYLSAVSDEVYIGKISDGNMTEMLYGSNIGYAISGPGSPQMFFQKDSRNIYIYNAEINELEAFELDVGEDMRIKKILLCGESILAILRDGNGDETVVISQVDALKKSN